MKKSLKMKTILCLILTIMTITLLQSFAFANTEKIQILKKDSNNYIIYVSGLLDEEFEFAFSNKSDEEKENLVFESSAKDQLDNGNYIVYVDNSNYSTYFEEKDDTYLWVRQGATYKLEAEEVDLSNALTENDIQELNNVTKKVKVTVGEMSLPVETNEEGVKVTRKIGTINLTPTEGSDYSYQMKKAELNSDESQLIKLIAELNVLENATEGNTIDKKLSVYSQLKDIYSKLKPAEDDTKWLEVKENVIQQDQNSKENEQYVVWIKETTEAGDSIIDVQIMTCADEYTEEYEKKEVIIKETSKLPITGDDITLFVVAGILVLLIAFVVILKAVNNKTNKKVS